MKANDYYIIIIILFIIMVNFFRKILIRTGKTIPFLLVFIVSVGYLENLYSIITNRIVFDDCGLAYYYCPISIYLSKLVYIDFLDVCLLYILAISLEFCKYNFRAIHYLLLNLAVSALVENVYLGRGVLITISTFMFVAGLFCIYGVYGLLREKF